jgi:hypothetical protein
MGDYKFLALLYNIILTIVAAPVAGGTSKTWSVANIFSIVYFFSMTHTFNIFFFLDISWTFLSSKKKLNFAKYNIASTRIPKLSAKQTPILLLTHLSTWKAFMSETTTAPAGIYARIKLFYTPNLATCFTVCEQHTISFSNYEMGMLPA